VRQNIHALTMMQIVDGAVSEVVARQLSTTGYRKRNPRPKPEARVWPPLGFFLQIFHQQKLYDVRLRRANLARIAN